MARARNDVTIPHMGILKVRIKGGGSAPRVVVSRFAQIQSGWQLDDMQAPFWRCYLPLERGGVVTLHGQEHQLDPTRIMLVAPGTPASARHWRDFDKAYANLLWEPEGRRPLPAVHERPSLPSERRELRQIAAAGDGTALSLFLLAISCRALGALGDDAFRPMPVVSPLIAEAMALIRKHPADPPGNETLGRWLGLHPGSLIRRFTAEAGCSPQRFSRECRLAEASRMLMESDSGIEEIADATGFGDRATFSRAFTRRWHCPPGVFRQRHR